MVCRCFYVFWIFLGQFYLKRKKPVARNEEISQDRTVGSTVDPGPWDLLPTPKTLPRLANRASRMLVTRKVRLGLEYSDMLAPVAVTFQIAVFFETDRQGSQQSLCLSFSQFQFERHSDASIGPFLVFLPLQNESSDGFGG